jgi:hypothetical protein
LLLLLPCFKLISKESGECSQRSANDHSGEPVWRDFALERRPDIGPRDRSDIGGQGFEVIEWEIIEAYCADVGKNLVNIIAASCASATAFHDDAPFTDKYLRFKAQAQ